MLNGWDVLAIFIAACVIYALIQKIIMAVLTAKALKVAKFLGTEKQEVLNQTGIIVKEATDALQDVLLKKVDDLDRKYIHLIDPENGVTLTLEKASKKGTKLHNEKIKVEKDGTVKAKSSTRTTKTKTTTANKTTKNKKEEK